MSLTCRVKPSRCLIIIGFLIISVWGVTVAAKHEFLRLKIFVRTHDASPIAGATVVVQRQSGDVTGKSDDFGAVEFSNLELEVTRAYTVKASAANYKPADLTISPTELADAIKVNKSIEHIVILEIAESPSPGIGGAAPSESPKTVTRPPEEHWYDFFVYLVDCLRTYWWLLLSVLVIATVTVLLLMGFRIKRFRNGQPVESVKQNIQWIREDIKRIGVDFREVKQCLDQLLSQQSSLASHLTAVENGVKELPYVSSGGAQGGNPGRSTNDLGERSRNVPSQADYYRAPPSPEEAARSAYQALTKGEVPLVDPIYLRTDVKSTPLAGFDNDEVHLQTVPNTQGAFVLFPDPDGLGGRVFPNPSVDFRPETLKRLFPRLAEMGETQFQATKAQIDPVRVRQIAQGRWLKE